jgi:riboflavin synthase
VIALASNRYSVLLIPHTLKITARPERHADDDVNLEVDLMACYATRLATALRTQP